LNYSQKISGAQREILPFLTSKRSQ